MTNERAIKLLHRLQDEQFDGIHGDERREALEMAVRALEGDGDTIYRKAAIIDALEGVDWYHINEATGKLVHGSTSDMESWYKVDDVRKAVEQLPSTRVATDINVGDTISRQAAIDAVAKAKVNAFPHDAGINNSIKAIKALPSAQPERKKGKWIEHNPHKWGLGIIFECSECGYEMDCEEPNYCPSCGARMGESE